MDFDVKKLTDLVVNFQHEVTNQNESKVRDIFRELAQIVFSYISPDGELSEMMREDAVHYAMQSISRFDMNRGNAFNYFSTLILSYYRQVIGVEKRKSKSK